MNYLKKSLLLLMAFGLVHTYSIAQENSTKKELGELYFVSETFVEPENHEVFIEYNKAYKKLADEQKGPEYYVMNANGSYRFSGSFGKEISGLGDFYKKWGDWNAKPDVKKLNEKYGYTESYYNTVIWRHAPELSYSKGESTADVAFNYRRYTEYYIKSDKVNEFKEIIKGYIAEYTKLGVEVKITSLWNVMGREAPCLMVVDDYKDEEDWVMSVKEYTEKTKENEQLKELSKRFYNTLRKTEQYEGYYMKDLSHSNEDN